MQTLKISDLKLGDVVELYEGPFATAVVKQIKDGLVWFYRPYGTHADFTCTSGVICYIGLEEFSRSVTDTSTVKVWHRAEHLK